MGKDVGLKAFFSDDERYADVVNGLGFRGMQVVHKEDLQDLDTQTGIWRGARLLRKPRNEKKKQRRKKRIKYRDMIRKVGMGVNFVIIGIENQEEVDYSLPLRNLVYDADEYERQAAKIRKEVRKNRNGLERGEYLYGFRKDSRLFPTVTFILYYGKNHGTVQKNYISSWIFGISRMS